MITCKQLQFSYKDKPIFHDLNFSLEDGSILCILGPNGVGKTTLLKSILQILPLQSGSIQLDTISLSEQKRKDIARLISYVPQAYHDTAFINTSVYHTILMGRFPFCQGQYRDEDYDMVDSILEEMHLQDLSFRNVKDLSGGEKQLVFIARALVQNCKVMILDEPLSSLDIKNQLEIIKLLVTISREKHITIITTIHDINLAVQLADKVLLLGKDLTYLFGDTKEIITPHNILNVYGVKSSILESGPIQQTYFPAFNESK